MAKKRDLLTDFDVEGFWWVPGADDRQVAGTLEFTVAAGLRLRLIGTLSDATRILDGSNVPLLLGLCQRTTVSLLGCHGQGSSLSVPGFAAETYRADLAIFNGHGEAPEDFVFTEYTMEFPLLGHFVNRTGLSQTIHFDDEERPKGYSISYEFPEEIAIDLDGGTLAVTFGWEGGGRRRRSDHITETVSLRWKPSDPVGPFEVMRRTASPIGNLLTLAFDLPTGLSAFAALIRDQDDERRVDRLPIIYHSQEIPPEPEKMLLPQDRLFTLEDLVDLDLAALVNRWFEVSAQFGRVMDLLFTMQKAKGTYLENRFLTYMQATELFHRLNPALSQKMLESEAHEARVAGVLDGAPDEEVREWLEHQLIWSNEPSLRRRMKDLRDFAGPAGGRLMTRKALGRAVDTRNYLTHYSPALKERAADGADLHWLTERVRYILMICLLREIGVGEDLCSDLAARNRRLEHALTASASWA